MLTAKLKKNGLWRKDDGKGRGATYVVSGSVAEMEQYAKAQGQYHLVDKETGEVLFIRREFSIINGRRVRNALKPQLTLGIRREGDGVFVDDSNDYLNFEAKVETQMVTEVAKLQALAFMGINLGDTSAAPAGQTQKAEKTLSPEEILLQLENEANGGTGINKPEEKPAEGHDAPPDAQPATVKDGAAGGVGDLK